MLNYESIASSFFFYYFPANHVLISNAITVLESSAANVFEDISAVR